MWRCVLLSMLHFSSEIAREPSETLKPLGISGNVRRRVKSKLKYAVFTTAILKNKSNTLPNERAYSRFNYINNLYEGAKFELNQINLNFRLKNIFLNFTSFVSKCYDIEVLWKLYFLRK